MGCILIWIHLHLNFHINPIPMHKYHCFIIVHRCDWNLTWYPLLFPIILPLLDYNTYMRNYLSHRYPVFHHYLTHKNKHLLLMSKSKCKKLRKQLVWHEIKMVLKLESRFYQVTWLLINHINWSHTCKYFHWNQRMHCA